MFADERVDGVLVSAVNFGDEQGVALAVEGSARNVPILIVGCQEESGPDADQPSGATASAGC